MSFLILKLKQNVKEPYAIYNLEKFGSWPFRKRRLIVGTPNTDKSDINLMNVSRTIKESFGEIVKTGAGWQYKFVDNKITFEGIFNDGLRIPVFDNVIEFREEL
jgi:hypothetical protein